MSHVERELRNDVIRPMPAQLLNILVRAEHLQLWPPGSEKRTSTVSCAHKTRRPSYAGVIFHTGKEKISYGQQQPKWSILIQKFAYCCVQPINLSQCVPVGLGCGLSALISNVLCESRQENQLRNHMAGKGARQLDGHSSLGAASGLFQRA